MFQISDVRGISDSEGGVLGNEKSPIALVMTKTMRREHLPK